MVRMSNLNIIIYVIIMMMTSQAGGASQCYSCSSVNDVNCGASFNSEGVATCSTESACAKVVSSNGEIVRSCLASTEQLPQSSACQSQDSAVACYCTSSLCNGAQQQLSDNRRATLALVVVAVVSCIRSTLLSIY